MSFLINVESLSGVSQSASMTNTLFYLIVLPPYFQDALLAFRAEILSAIPLT